MDDCGSITAPGLGQLVDSLLLPLPAPLLLTLPPPPLLLLLLEEDGATQTVTLAGVPSSPVPLCEGA